MRPPVITLSDRRHRRSTPLKPFTVGLFTAITHTKLSSYCDNLDDCDYTFSSNKRM